MCDWTQLGQQFRNNATQECLELASRCRPWHILFAPNTPSDVLFAGTPTSTPIHRGEQFCTDAVWSMRGAHLRHNEAERLGAYFGRLIWRYRQARRSVR